MPNLPEKINCCGCQACAQKCPQHCITMRADNEGFLYPHVDESRCVHCGLCEKVCPIRNKPQTFAPLAAYGARHKNAQVKQNSSSGGIFTALAQEIFKKGGVVFGAAFDKNWNVFHTYAENAADLDVLCRSKYVQSDVRQAYQQAKSFLDSGRAVLFSGTPCQLAGLRNFLGKPYDNLLTVGIICHAAPSPAVWQNFLHENFDLSSLKAINFRDKQLAWTHFYLSFLCANGLRAHGTQKRISEVLLARCKTTASTVFRNAYLQAFLRELINRPSCHACQFKGISTQLADITLGDLWGSWPQIITKEDLRLGVSGVLVNTEKGKTFFQKIAPHISAAPISMEHLAKTNSALTKSTKPHPKRAEFFARFENGNTTRLIHTYLGLRPTWVQVPCDIVGRLFYYAGRVRARLTGGE